MANLSNLLPPGNLVTESGAQTLSNKTMQAANMAGATQFGGSSGTSGQVVRSQGAGSDSVWADGASLQEFTENGTWTKPSWAQFVMVELWGGGGGASANGTNSGKGGDGGAGLVRVYAW